MTLRTAVETALGFPLDVTDDDFYFLAFVASCYAFLLVAVLARCWTRARGKAMPPAWVCDDGSGCEGSHCALWTDLQTRTRRDALGRVRKDVLLTCKCGATCNSISAAVVHQQLHRVQR